MPEPIKPGIVPKIALTASRIGVKPFEVPAHMTQSALAEGAATHMIVAKTNAAVREGVNVLQPRGPLAKIFNMAFDRIDRSVGVSASRAEHATAVFWKPFSESSAKTGQSLVSPVAAYYARKAGFPNPTDPELLAKLVHSKGYPVPTASAEEPAPEPKAPQSSDPATPPADEPAPPATQPSAPADQPATPPAAQPPAPADEPASGPAGDQPAPPAPPAG